MFAPGKPFQPSLMFVGKAGAYPSEKHLSDAPRKGRLLAFPTNITLGWKGLPGINALAYYEKSSLTAVKSFITLATGLNLMKLFFLRL